MNDNKKIPSWYKNKAGDYIDLSSVNIDEFIKSEKLEKISQNSFPVYRNKSDILRIGKFEKIVKTLKWENDVLKYGYCVILEV